MLALENSFNSEVELCERVRAEPRLTCEEPQLQCEEPAPLIPFLSVDWSNGSGLKLPIVPLTKGNTDGNMQHVERPTQEHAVGNQTAGMWPH